LKFELPNVFSFRARSLGDFCDQSSAIRKYENTFELSTDKLNSPNNNVLLTFEYELDNEKFLDDLVSRDIQRDISKSGGDSDTYWISAQLKHPKVLNSNYGRLDLRDVDVGVNVAVYQDLKSAIPHSFIRNLELIRDWIRTKDRTQKFRLGYAHLMGSSRTFAGNEDNIIEEAQKLFLPHNFRSFVDVSNPFRYSDAIRGADFYDLPFSTFPKSMRVVARTNLNLNTPAADGNLIYKKKDLKDQIHEIVGELKTKKIKRRRRGKIAPVSKIAPRIIIAQKETPVKVVIQKKLRAIIRTRPTREADITDAIENLFIALDYDFKREKTAFAYSTKSYIPDFTSDSLEMAMDVKLCKTPSDEKRIIDEINADIPAYKTRFKNLLFTVYDLGCIRDVSSFIGDIESNNKNVSVIVIKH
jgi:hypothetical protein